MLELDVGLGALGKVGSKVTKKVESWVCIGVHFGRT